MMTIVKEQLDNVGEARASRVSLAKIICFLMVFSQRKISLHAF